MGLFKKELCTVCGIEKTGLLDKKCADGKICKGCADKISPWFSGLKNCSSSDVKNHIAKKDGDLERIKNDFNFSMVFGEFGVILIDSEKRSFCALPDTSTGLFGSQRTVNSIDDILDLRPDLFSFDDVKDIDIDITEIAHEDKKVENGVEVSYNPPRFIYHITFTLRFRMKDEKIPSIHIQLNNEALKIKNEGRRIWTSPGKRLAAHLLHLPSLIIENQEKFYNNKNIIDWFYHSEYELPKYSYGFKCTLYNMEDIRKYHGYLTISKIIKETIIGKDM